MKKLINNPDMALTESIRGLVAANPSLEFIEDRRLILRKERKEKGKVIVLTGSGSGHEPDLGGYVGKGMLDGACAGPIFAAPNAESIYTATKMLDNGAGVLYIIKNYTGDRAHFSMAAELAEVDGVETRTVIVNDDVAVKDSTFTAGRRGVAGIIFNYKITCAKAEMGASLGEVEEISKRVNDNTRTMGLGLTSCIPPQKGAPIFDIADDEMEIGLGIHGEPGRERCKLKTADESMEILTNAVIEDLPYRAGDEVAVMVNGLGGTTFMELYIAYNTVHRILLEKGIRIFKVYVNEYCTSLDMAGCSVTLTKLDDEMRELLLYPVDIPYFVF